MSTTSTTTTTPTTPTTPSTSTTLPSTTPHHHQSDNNNNNTTSDRLFTWQHHPNPLIQTPFSVSGATTTDPYTTTATSTALLYNIFLRALNSIYIQAPGVQLGEYKNFASYCLAAYECVVAQMGVRETYFWGCVGREMEGQEEEEEGRVKSREKEEHGDQGNAGREKFWEWGGWLKSIDGGRNNFSPEMCRGMMDDFMAPLHSFFCADVSRVEALSSSSSFASRHQLANDMENKLDIRAVARAERERFLGKLDKKTQLPLLWVNCDVEFEGGIHRKQEEEGLGLGLLGPPGWWMRVRNARRNREWWKFGCTGFDGRARGLVAGGGRG